MLARVVQTVLNSDLPGVLASCSFCNLSSCGNKCENLTLPFINLLGPPLNDHLAIMCVNVHARNPFRLKDFCNICHAGQPLQLGEATQSLNLIASTWQTGGWVWWQRLQRRASVVLQVRGWPATIRIPSNLPAAFFSATCPTNAQQQSRAGAARKSTCTLPWQCPQKSV